MITKELADWIEWYPTEDDEDYDGVHDGGIKGAKKNAPPEIKEEIYIIMKDIEEGFCF